MTSESKSEQMEIDGVVEPDSVAAPEIDEYEVAFEELEDSNDAKINDFLKLLENTRSDEAAVKIKEKCIYRIARAYTEEKRFSDVANILNSNSDFFNIIPKAKTAKIVRNIVNIVSSIPDSLAIQIQLCRDIIVWCKAEKRTFLRQRIEAKLSSLYLQQGDPTGALALVIQLLGELRKLDDKQLLTEAHLTESRVYHALQNIPKAKAALTASRTAANCIYVVPLLQAEMDEMSGVLHCEEGDHVTAYSYFLEAFEAFAQAAAKDKGGPDVASSRTRAATCLQYMALSKVLADSANEVASLLSNKNTLRFSGEQGVLAMAAIAQAAQQRSLELFQTAVDKYSVCLRSDGLVSHQLDGLYQRMLEANLLKLIFPYSVVEIAYVAELIALPLATVERKLSQMILDHKFPGILDQGSGHLITHAEVPADRKFELGVNVVGSMGAVVDALFAQSKGLVKSSA